MDFYKTILRAESAEFKDRGSRFLAFAFPVPTTELFKEKLQELKKDHPKANHHCFAYRLGTDGTQYRVSDDGEPSGTAGRPILGQIDSRGLTNTGIVVVRYFGGTLLGVPGLINAYKMSAMLALQVAPVAELAIEVPYAITCTYHEMNEVLRIVKMCGGTILQNEQSLFCRFTVGLPKNRAAEAVQMLEKIYQVEINPLK
jgi:uncharacterized YigZ family protein